MPCCVLCAGKGSEIGDYLTTHPAVDCISFTGGDTSIGRHAELCCACYDVLCAVLWFLFAGKGSEIGDYLTTHPAVDCISFTGGDTGIAISKKAGMVPLQMELGGKDACIVCR